MSAVLESALDAQRRADCALNDRALADELQAMADAMPNRVRDAQLRQSAASPRMGPPAPARRVLFPASDYGLSCILCGGTPRGESFRGFVGRCTCGGRA